MLSKLKANYFDNMLRAKKAYAKVIDPVCKRWNLTRNELDILLFLHNNPEFDRASDIVTRRGIAKSHVSLSVTNLEKRELIRRETDPADHRTIHLILSDSAHEIAREGRAAQEAFFYKLYDGLTTEEVAQWQGIMTKVNENIANLEV